MKRWGMLFVLTGFLIFVPLVNISAADEDENKVEEISSDLDKENPEVGEAKKVEARLQDHFGVTDTQIDNLRKQKLGYGEISTVFSLAKQMPGGINDENIQKITVMRQGSGHKVGWGKIAQELGVKLAPAVKDVEHVHGEAPEQKMGKTTESVPKDQGVRQNHDIEHGPAAEHSMKPQTPAGSHGGGYGHSR